MLVIDAEIYKCSLSDFVFRIFTKTNGSYKIGTSIRYLLAPVLLIRDGHLKPVLIAYVKLGGGARDFANLGLPHSYFHFICIIQMFYIQLRKFIECLLICGGS